jgi:Raf kinase inhibitor-like YbhB/YbcL family protein
MSRRIYCRRPFAPMNSHYSAGKRLWETALAGSAALLLHVPICFGQTPAESPNSIATSNAVKGVPLMQFTLSSSGFAPGQAIPRKYSCDGQDISPPLTWGEPPQNTRSLALVADDPDAPGGTYVHWVLYNMPPHTRALPEAVHKNSWGRLGYGGPCPPGGTHRYFFKLYALDRMLDLAAGASKQRLLEAMQSHILGEADLMGTYSRD